MRVGILDLLVDEPVRSPLGRLYAEFFRKQFVTLMPQAVAVWCRQLGHEVHYATYYGVGRPERLLPDTLDVVFVATYTQASALAYALAKLFRARGTRTVLGGPHATAFPEDAQRFFDLVVLKCDRALVADIVAGRCDARAIVSCGRTLTEFPTVEERMPEIRKAAFFANRPHFMSVVPLLSSIGCPYRCDFCIDWDTDYVALSRQRLEDDLRYLSENFPGLLIAFHDPNFAVQFDATMEILARIPDGRRNRYVMESSLSILKENRLPRLRETNCVYVAPGIESWDDYSNKAGVGAKRGVAKLEQVVAHFRLLGRHVPGMQANFLFGADVDRGREPVETTKEFIRRLPLVWPTINIPTPFGATPLFARYVAEGRIVKPLPFAFYYNPYLAITLRHYGSIEYYDHLIDMHEVIVSTRMVASRLLTRSRPGIRFIHTLRAVAARVELAAFRRMRKQLVADPHFRAFHDGRSERLPEYYRAELRRRLGRYAELLSDADVAPDWDRLEDGARAIKARQAAAERARRTHVPHNRPSAGELSEARLSPA
jgi:radical SAM superfamily enzyme YgiQ (UPF0313 family)